MPRCSPARQGYTAHSFLIVQQGPITPPVATPDDTHNRPRCILHQSPGPHHASALQNSISITPPIASSFIPFDISHLQRKKIISRKRLDDSCIAAAALLHIHKAASKKQSRLLEPFPDHEEAVALASPSGATSSP
ncbi:hypothetical protein I350_02511 [Cryptococcus amylolentus CBS 6273]|uniref:Uncharacterized protein n=1 Tax=Cryptococcus amylolentus CBS 6273 TaxID=1296118 RepID=A0A1E3KDC0_9TREE|nr:hypothetical protein I350_02511 [Cryptococcus amylolentus CBS 6273]